MRNAMILGISLLLSLTAACRVEKSAPAPTTGVQRSGESVAYNHGCKDGCNDLARGDVILSVDGQPVETRTDLLQTNLIDDQTTVLEILRPGETTPRHVEIQAKPHRDYPPLEDVPPFWTVGAEALD